MGVTLREVAKAAGVSSAAASKVLHGAGGTVRVGDERAKIIREVAAKLNYRPNRLARSLRKSTTNTIGLVFENFGSIADGPLYYPYLLDGVASVVFASHYRLTILPEVDSQDIWGTLADGRLDGVIWCKYDPGKTQAQPDAEIPIPVVLLNAFPPIDNSNLVTIRCDNEEGSELAVKYLASLGHQRVGFVMEGGELETPDAVARKTAFAKAAKTHLPCSGPEDLLVWERDGADFAQWWSSKPEQTALIAWNERMAAQILRRAEEAGVRVPEELSLVGFDSTAFCDTVKPRLTAVRQPIREMARSAAETVLEMVRDHAPAQRLNVWPCTLDVRESTAPPAQR